MDTCARRSLATSGHKSSHLLQCATFIALGLSVRVLAQSEITTTESHPPASTLTTPTLWEGVPEAAKSHGKWSFEFGVGVIANTEPRDYLYANYQHLNGPGEGVTYNFTVSYRLHEFDWRTKHLRLQPEIEIPFMLTLVDQRVGGLVPDINTGLVVRWRDFPWNRYVYTTFAIGGGFSYSFSIWTADNQRHPGEDRSNIKFWLPIEWTFALPSHPRHQFTLFVDHQSGGEIFDNGGVDAWGFGYRFLL